MTKSSSDMMRLDREFIAYMRCLKKALTTDIREMSYPKISKKLVKLLPPADELKGKWL